ncbi:RING finger protein 32 [Myxocyprinus asiaticus]|uniref:RING finger protein 32 n=1 Tax=Myxocyprinus asiaticus TaxID=70543 RepID=UPI0022216560|nr:RING finger protein 32 [Myxocyprinus asiaticus]
MPRQFICKAESGRLTLTAVAIQDHITRSISVRNIPCNLLASDVSCRAAFGAAHGSRRHKKQSTRQRVKDAEQTQEQEEHEYVLDPAPPPLTLAQRMGLVAAPSRRLTAEEWAEVKARSIQEGDSTLPCVICREEFRLQPQVLLSCSHVFHKVCLRSFENFSGRKSCPMCRKEQYETRVIYDGARLYREKCAIRIQAFWRGYLVRKWYRNIRKHVPPKDQQLRRRFFEKKFQEISDSLVQSCSTDVDAFLNDIDHSVAMSHNILRRFDNEYMSVSKMEEKDWLEAQEKAVQRGVQDCPICLNSLNTHNCMSKDGRNVLLLSCSHLFHEPCLQAFELFCQEVKPTCPLCRSRYTKMLV